MWKSIHRQSPYRRSEVRKYTPNRSQRSFLDTSFSRLNSKEKNEAKKLMNSSKPINFHYTVSTEWIIKLQKALKSLFKEVRSFCNKISKQMERMNAKNSNIMKMFGDQMNKKLTQILSSQPNISKDYGIWQSLDLSPIKANKQSQIKVKTCNSVIQQSQPVSTQSKQIFSPPPSQKIECQIKTIKHLSSLLNTGDQIRDNGVYDYTKRLAKKLQGINKSIEEKKRKSESPVKEGQ